MDVKRITTILVEIKVITIITITLLSSFLSSPLSSPLLSSFLSSPLSSPLLSPLSSSLPSPLFPYPLSPLSSSLLPSLLSPPLSSPLPSSLFAAKVAMGGGSKRDHATPNLKKLGWLRIENTYKYEICIMVYNILNESIPNYILSLPNVRDIRPLPTRQQNQLYVPHTNTTTGDRSALVAAPRLWNSLPACVRNAGTIFSFKRQLLRHFLMEQFNIP